MAERALADYKLIYFDIPGGRGEPLRIALHAAGIDYRDERWEFPEFNQRRGDLRFRAVPVLLIDGEMVTQSNAIGRYVAKQAGLYPDDPLQALYCDEVCDAVEDLTHYVVQTFGLKGDALRVAREQLVEIRLKTFLNGFDELLRRGGGEFFAGGKLTIADLKMFVQISSLSSGNLEHVPPDLVEQIAPSLLLHQTRVIESDVVTAYRDAHV